MITSELMNMVSAPIMPPTQSTASRTSTSTYSFNLDGLLPPSETPTTLNHGFHICTILTTKCTSQYARLHPGRGTAGQLHFGLQQHSQTWSIAGSWCIPQLTQSCPLSKSPTMLNYSHKVRMLIASMCNSKLSQSQSQSATQYSLILDLQVHHPYLTIMSLMCISKST